jgi:hypothetical protein
MILVRGFVEARYTAENTKDINVYLIGEKIVTQEKERKKRPV